MNPRQLSDAGWPPRASSASATVNLALDKPGLDQPNDSIIALAMALDALENQPEPVEVLGWL